MVFTKKRRKERLPPVDEEQEVEELAARVVEEAPAPGTQPYTADGSGARTFDTLPLSQFTQRGLSDGKFKTMTEIQVAAIPHALAGRDVLGAAQTGSGKTLAFLVPLLERLYRARLTAGDGLGALVISPTRELALQIFEVLRTVGRHHGLAAGVVTGGKKEFREEQAMVQGSNILVATPGRLLQHLEQTPGFDTSLLQVLVLDEADRILDMGFQEQLNSVLDCLPPSRQTMLFSATQTRSVKNLARLSLKKNTVEYVAVRTGKEECATPAKLVQNYVVCKLERKLDVLMGFLKTHLKSKLIVFLNSCAQVRFVHLLFCALQPGTPLLALHGKCKQARRTQIYTDFLRKPAAVLFATDVAARGLDFPDVDWVIQVDAPEDVDGYVHRVGRTARYKSGGRALLVLLPSEEAGALEVLGEKNIPISKLTVNPDKLKMAGSVRKKASAEVAADVEKKRLAEKAFTSYVRSIHLMPNKKIFRMSELPLEEFAMSLGLPEGAASRLGKQLGLDPHVEREGQGEGLGGEAGRDEQRRKKNVNRSLERLKEQIKAEKLRRRQEREGKLGGAGPSGGVAASPVSSSQLPQSGQSGAKEAGRDKRASKDGGDGDSGEGDEEEDGGLVLVKKKRKKEGRQGQEAEEEEDEEEFPDASEALAVGRKRKRKELKTRIGADGVAVAAVAAGARKKVFREEEEEEGGGRVRVGGKSGADTTSASAQYVEKVKARLKSVEAEDKAQEQRRVREKHVKQRLKTKSKATNDSDDELEEGVTLGGGSQSGEGSESEEEQGGAAGDSSEDGESGEDEEEEEEGGGGLQGGLEEQEDAVLRLLAGRKGHVR